MLRAAVTQGARAASTWTRVQAAATGAPARRLLALSNPALPGSIARTPVSLLTPARRLAQAAAAVKANVAATAQGEPTEGSLMEGRPKDLFAPLDTFERRHNGSGNPQDVADMLATLQMTSLEELVAKTVPADIRVARPLNLPQPVAESTLLKDLKAVAQLNKIYRSYIGMGYHGTHTPAVILRNIMENPAWYTQYTPYQPEISQGRLESLLNFQTLITDLTGLDIANASLLDEGTAAAEAMMMSFSQTNQEKKTFFVDSETHPQTIACLQSRAEPFNIKVVVGDFAQFDGKAFANDLCGALVQYPNTKGAILDYSAFGKQVHQAGGLFVMAADPLALTVLKAPADFGADIALGSAQRFGVPLGYGGPHAAYFACKDALKRRMPGRLIGVSRDAQGKKALRLTLQTREQHIRREKATSNICTAQALLANMAAMYAVYHGPKGLRDIAHRVHAFTAVLRQGVAAAGHDAGNEAFFDTLAIKINPNFGTADTVIASAEAQGINLRKIDSSTVGVSFDETVTKDDLRDLLEIFGASTVPVEGAVNKKSADLVAALGLTQQALPDLLASSLNAQKIDDIGFPEQFRRTRPLLEHEIFNVYHSEHELLRYMYRLQSRDLSLVTSMIPLGSCTMKLNATTEMIPVTWPEFGSIHPFAPAHQAQGYHRMFRELSRDLCEVTGFDAVSLQPNSGAMGEYAGLRAIRQYLISKNEGHRNVCLIPVSAHGTNPASAMMCGMEVVVVKCDEDGNLDFEDLKAKAEANKDRLAAVMITYPSTFGVFELGVRRACELIHSLGGQVYLDGANMNAQVGLCRPGDYGADVCHLNLHKTFCIPHGGGGPGMGPICVKQHLAPFLPSHPIVPTGGEQGVGPVAAAPFSSASILTISYAYIRMMGGEGLTRATQMALLNANYMRQRLEKHYKVLYTNENGMCAHEFIIDLRDLKERAGVEAIDVAKRLQDYGFHSPTMSWPVANTLMLEPTESESKRELDRLCDALIAIRAEIAEIEAGKQPRAGNVLKNAPHTAAVVSGDNWKNPYSRKQAAYPLPYVEGHKFWPTVSRVDDTFGDRNLVCTCPPLEDYVK